MTVAGSEVLGLLDNEYEPVQIGNQIIESNVPVLVCRSSDVAAVVHGSAVIVDGDTYAVREVRKDGTGITELVLTESA